MKQKGKNRLTHIKGTTIATYSIVLIFIAFTLKQIYDSKKDIDLQKTELESQYRELSLINRLSVEIYRIQTISNLNNREKNVRKEIESHKENIRKISDSLSILTGDEEITSQINEVISLVNAKEQNRRNLEKLLSYNPVAGINNRIREIEDSSRQMTESTPDSITIVKTVKDTIMKKRMETTFWERLKYAFSPARTADSIAYISTMEIDTLVANRPDSLSILSELRIRSEEASEEYYNTVESITGRFNEILENDRVITSKISSILVNLQTKRLGQIYGELDEKEAEIEKYLNYSIILAIVSVTAIIALILLLIRSFKRITESNRSLEEEKQKVIEIMESRHSLLLSASHDIKTPLSSITGYLSLWEDPGKKEEIDSMLNSARYINSLIENLLKFSALNRGKLILEKSECDIYEIIVKIDKMFETIAANKKTRILFSNSIKKGTVASCDPLKTEQIITNILSNAIKYGNGKDILFNSAINGGFLEIKIEDSGIGIAEDKLNEIFELFSRMEEGKAVSSGDGVGMYVVKGLIDLTGGTIDIKSAENKGTCVNIRIPVSLVRTDNKSLDSEFFTNGAKSKIGIVDDEISILKVLSAILRKIGMKEYSIFRTYEEFERGIVNDKYDIIITDLEMDGCSGYDILDFTRKTDEIRNSATYVATMTGRSDINAADLLKRGFNGVFHKPLTIDTARKVISSYLSYLSGLPEKEAAEEKKAATVYEMFKDDPESLKTVMETFKKSGAESVKEMEKALKDGSFDNAARICHKIKPGFIQFGAPDEMISMLEKIDSSRNAGTVLPEWEMHIGNFLTKAETFIDSL